LIAPLVFSTLPASPTIAQNFARQKKPEIIIEDPVLGLQHSEQFFYTVRWMGIPVGHASLTVEEKAELDGHPVTRVTAIAESNRFLSKFYPLKDVIHSYIDQEEGFSRKFKKSQREGRYQAEEEMRYDHDSGKAFYHSLLNGSKKEMTIPYGIHDPLSAFYAFRQEPVDIGQTLRMTVNSDEKNWDVDLVIRRTQVLELKGVGVFPCIEVEPVTRLKGLLVERGRLWAYLSVDERRIPVMFKITTPWGTVSGALRKGGSLKK